MQIPCRGDWTVHAQFGFGEREAHVLGNTAKMESMFFTYSTTKHDATEPSTLKLHYEVHGEGLPMLIVHGRGCDMRLMTGCMEPVFAPSGSARDRQLRRIYIDLPGMGQSSSNLDVASADGMLDVLHAFVDQEIDGKFLLAGESYGGYLCQGLLDLMRERVAGIMLLCPVVVPDFASRALPEPLDEASAAHMQDSSYLATLGEREREDFLKNIVYANAHTHERYLRELKSGINVADVQFIRALSRHYALSFDVRARLLAQPFAGPALLVDGRQDHVVGYEDAWSLLPALPRATFAVLDTAGHNAQLERAELFTALVRDWLDRLAQP